MQQQLEADIDNEAMQKQVQDQEMEIEKLMDQDESIWQQKSRVKWDTQGERCTSYFFMMTKIRQSKDLIKEMRDYNGGLMRDQEQIGSFITSHFQEKFKYQPTSIDHDLIKTFRTLFQQRTTTCSAFYLL
ncbi:hypothetical protein FRX31_021547 [Thalictrum thalictroides]|uniref:Uncharacterized protein n=1 Tax=Thalictrum thalictroides TaxID=46969 RepID=A0A7J6VXE0_THATH|nr:hypothetical protein FRX31_021547 [Thalictrum thalictroides]